MHEQTSLGTKKLHVRPRYDQVQIGYVTSTKDYKAYGRVNVVCLDYSVPFPVWVSGSIDREPVEGDQVILGFLLGRPDAPYLAGFVRNESYTSNFIRVEQDRIILQIPTDLEDIKSHLMDDSKSESRITIELTVGGIKFRGEVTATNVTATNVTATNVTATNVTASGEVTSVSATFGGRVAACIGDTVSVDVPSIGLCVGTITGV